MSVERIQASTATQAVQPKHEASAKTDRNPQRYPQRRGKRSLNGESGAFFNMLGEAIGKTLHVVA